MRKFCCDSFQCRHDGDRGMGVNIRIIRLSEHFIKRAQHNGNVNGYLIAEGYSATLNEKVKSRFIKFYPFRGKVRGTNPVLPTNATVKDNVEMQHDFRSLYASILQNWFMLDQKDVNTVLNGQFPQVQMI